MKAPMVTRRATEVTDTVPVIPTVAPVSRVWRTAAEVTGLIALAALLLGVAVTLWTP